LCVHLAGHRRSEQLPERRSRHGLGRQTGLIVIPAGPEIISAVLDGIGADSLSGGFNVLYFVRRLRRFGTRGHQQRTTTHSQPGRLCAHDEHWTFHAAESSRQPMPIARSCATTSSAARTLNNAPDRMDTRQRGQCERDSVVFSFDARQLARGRALPRHVSSTCTTMWALEARSTRPRSRGSCRPGSQPAAKCSSLTKKTSRYTKPYGFS